MEVLNEVDGEGDSLEEHGEMRVRSTLRLEDDVRRNKQH